MALACDTYEFGCALFKEFSHCPHVFNSGNDLLHHIRSSGDSSQIHGYLIHSLRFKDSDTTATFWQVQTTIIAQLRCLRNLQVFVAIVIPDHEGRCVKLFIRQLKTSGWCISTFDDVFFPDHGNTVSGRCNIVIGVHSSCSSTVAPIDLKPSPPIQPQRLCLFLWEPFNRTEHLVSLARDYEDFICQDTRFTTTEPTLDKGVVVKYYLHGHGADESILNGSAVISSDGLCPPFYAGSNQNLFQHLFGIEFHYEGHTRVRGISPYKFARCFGFVDDLTYRLSHPSCKFALDAAIPSNTSAWIFDQVHAALINLRDANGEIFSPNQWAAPAATIQSFVNGAPSEHSFHLTADGFRPTMTTQCVSQSGGWY